MSTAVASTRVAALDWNRLFHAIPLIVLCLAGVLVAAAYDLAFDSSRLVTELGDTDDATRLVQVRELRATGAWFDRTLPSIGAPEALNSHWSRLIDAPLAAMMAGFEPVTGAEVAELLTRAIWPMLVLLALLYVIADTARARSGPLGALIAVGLAATAQSGLAQFGLGRIDHHNVMILGAVGGSLLLARALTQARLGWAAGALLGLGTAIGYEGLALTISVLVLAAALAALYPAYLMAVFNTATGFTVALLAVFLVTLAPAQWGAIHCDALSANLIVLAAAGTAGLSACLYWRDPLGVAGRFAVLAGCGAIGMAVFARMEPACLAGPFGQVDPAVVPIWLAHVQESQTVLQLAGDKPAAAIVALGFPLFGLFAYAVLQRTRPAVENLFGMTVLAIAVLLGCWQIKFGPYGTFLAVVPLAVLIASIGRVGDISAPTMRGLAFVLLNQRTFAMLALCLVPTKSTNSGPANRCYQSEYPASLAALPAGLVVADVDLGAFIAALSPHRVEAAPYHRIDQAIIENNAIMYGTAADAERRLRALGANYVVTCSTFVPPPAVARSVDGGLRAQLLKGEAPAFLEAIPLSPGNPLRAWRVVP